MNYYFIFIFIISFAILITFINKILFMTAKFSTTQSLGEEETKIYNKYNKSLDYLYKQVPRIDYPFNDSEETKEEIELLLKLKNTRPDNMKEIILYELKLANMINMFTDNNRERFILNNFIMKNINPIIMKIKVYYDRIRPSYLNDEIEPVVENPEHPAYPSGHATQAYFIAHVLSDKYPKNRLKYLKLANKITLNRERGGFHFRSDSNYGRKIAKVLSNNFKADKNFLNKI